MGYREMDLVWAKSQATRLDKFVLLAIAKTYNVGKGSYPSQKHLAKMTGIADARGIRRSLQRLTDLGELVWVRGSNNSGKSNVYFITFIEQPVAKLTAIADTKMTAVSDQNDRYTSDQNDPLLNKRLNKLLDAEKLVFDSTFQSAFMLQAVDRVKGVLPPLQVVELIESFASSYECLSAYTDDVRLTRFYALLDSAASQARREM
jgi:alkylated DNA nucleotide flippase Atl1